MAAFPEESDQAHDSDGGDNKKADRHGENPPSLWYLSGNVHSDDVGNDDSDAQHDDCQQTALRLTPLPRHRPSLLVLVSPRSII
jgi:hypothetical protein